MQRIFRQGRIGGDDMESAKQPTTKKPRRIRFGSFLWFICLVISLSADVFWVHSYFRRLTIRLCGGHMQSLLVIDRGVLVLHYDIVPGRTFATARFGEWDFTDEIQGHETFPEQSPPDDFLGFGRHSFATLGPKARRDTSLTLAIPMWFVVLASALLALAPSLLTIRARRRIARGACGGCGYDLMGNTMGVCPECGRPI